MMKSTQAIAFEKQLPDALKALASAKPAVDAAGLDPLLQHLIHLRASQINGCAFCVKMHTREARQDGETSERLDRVVVWRHVDDFSPGERAALAYTEAMTRMDDQSAVPRLRAGLREYFSEREVAAVALEVAMINLWNRVAIPGH